MSSTYPIYKRSKNNKAIIKFVDRNEGYVIDPGNTNFEMGSLQTDWNPHYEACWEHYDYVDPSVPARTPDQLELFETIRLTGISSSTLTKVPNGYVMTSSSGHQLFIKDLSKESL